MPECTAAAVKTLGMQNAAENVVIDYTYDALGRLTGASYDDDTYYRYTYDAVDNRLSETSESAAHTYAYDAANRLTSVDGAMYTWDDNGNLLSDSSRAYTYDPANRLTAVSGTGYAYEYVYNGSGDRVKSILDGTATTYTLDLNSGLTQVLADGSNTYLYGYTRIAQVSHDAAGYFLGDALGSVRQVTDPEAEIVLMQSYSPYGETTVSFGEFETGYSYTGEMTDESGLINLRARMYDPGSGRFLTMDSWSGDYQNPITLAKWVYANANPVRYTDPSGRYVYNRAKAVSYAMNWDYQSIIDPTYDFTYQDDKTNFENQCTLFASSVLYEGGVRDPRPDPDLANNPTASDLTPPYWDISYLFAGSWIWYGYSHVWSNTPLFHSFTSKVIGYEVMNFNNPPNYNKENWYSVSNQNNEWEEKLQSFRGTIQKGDLIFYDRPGGSEWDHVAIVVGWAYPTNLGEKPMEGENYPAPSGSANGYSIYQWAMSIVAKCGNKKDLPLRPIVVERSGGVNYNGFRALDNTTEQQTRISIVHIYDNK